MNKLETTKSEDLSNLMKIVLGTAIVSMATSMSTHHITASAHGPVTVGDISHFMEKHREVLHAHSSLGRARYATITGTDY